MLDVHVSLLRETSELHVNRKTTGRGFTSTVPEEVSAGLHLLTLLFSNTDTARLHDPPRYRCTVELFVFFWAGFSPSVREAHCRHYKELCNLPLEELLPVKRISTFKWRAAVAE